MRECFTIDVFNNLTCSSLQEEDIADESCLVSCVSNSPLPPLIGVFRIVRPHQLHVHARNAHVKKHQRQRQDPLPLGRREE